MLKNVFNPAEGEAALFNYRLMNRTFVAAMILAIARVLQLWIRWRDEQSDPELPASFRYEERQIGATFALLAAGLLVALIAAVDFLSPANFNLAILYVLPLFICGWTQSRRFLWSTLAVLLVLTILAFLFRAQATVNEPGLSLQRNRLLAAASMCIVATILHFWMDPFPHAERGWRWCWRTRPAAGMNAPPPRSFVPFSTRISRLAATSRFKSILTVE